MYNSKLLEVFKKFDESKINNFSQYINIYKSKRENATIKLFELINAEFPNFESKKLEKNKAHIYLMILGSLIYLINKPSQRILLETDKWF